MARKIFIILILLILLGAAGAGAYYFYFHKTSESAAVKPDVFVSEKVISPILSFDGQKVWYLLEDGKLYRKFLDTGTKEEYSLPETLTGTQKIIWQEEGSDFIILAGTRYRFYSFDKRAFVDYPPQQKQTAFLEKLKKIVYIWEKVPGRFELKISDFGGQNFEKVMDLTRGDYELIPDPQNKGVVLLARSANGGRGQIDFVDLANHRSTNLRGDGAFLGAKFSPLGDKLAIVYADKLEVLEMSSKKSQSAAIDLQSAGQIAWSKNGQFIMAATADGVFKIDAKKLTIENISNISMNGLQPTELIYHPTQNLLFFVDQSSRQLYKLNF